jgi:hypothetical protein
LFIAVFFVFKEVFIFFDLLAGSRTWILSGATVLLALAIAWISDFLPLVFISQACFLALIFLLLRDGLLNYFKGHLDLPLIFRQLTFFVLLTLVIFATARWTI